MSSVDKNLYIIPPTIKSPRLIKTVTLSLIKPTNVYFFRMSPLIPVIRINSHRLQCKLLALNAVITCQCYHTTSIFLRQKTRAERVRNCIKTLKILSAFQYYINTWKTGKLSKGFSLGN